MWQWTILANIFFSQHTRSAEIFVSRLKNPVIFQTTNQLYIRQVAPNLLCYHRCLNQLAPCPVQHLKQRGPILLRN